MTAIKGNAENYIKRNSRRKEGWVNGKKKSEQAERNRKEHTMQPLYGLLTAKAMERENALNALARAKEMEAKLLKKELLKTTTVNNKTVICGTKNFTKDLINSMQN